MNGQTRCLEVKNIAYFGTAGVYAFRKWVAVQCIITSRKIATGPFVFVWSAGPIEKGTLPVIP
jgi:hypothetical protein